MRYALVFGALVVVAIAAAQLGSWSRSTRPAEPAAAPVEAAPVRPREPPRPGRDAPPELNEPPVPTPTPEMRAEIAERARGAAQPGMTAFRAFADLYVDANPDLARRQAESEGITVDEVRE